MPLPDKSQLTKQEVYLTEYEAEQLKQANLKMWRAINAAKTSNEYVEAIKTYLHHPELEQLLQECPARTTVQLNVRLRLLSYYRLALIEDLFKKLNNLDTHKFLKFRTIIEEAIDREFTQFMVKERS